MGNPNQLKWSFLVLPLVLTSCSGPTRSFPSVGRLTRIEITDNHDRTIKIIEDERRIGKVIAFIDEHRTGWGTPLAGVPIPTTIANLYDGEEFRGHFGVGPDFFETQREGDFVSKPASEGERREFLDLIGVRGD